MTSKPREANKKDRSRAVQRRQMTAQEHSAAATTVLPSLQDPDDATLSFGPRSLDPDRRTERLSYRDPEEPSQGPLRFDETNYSVERLTLPEGGYNEYADEYSSYRDEEGVPRMHNGPIAGGEWQNPQYADAPQSDVLDGLPPSGVSPAYEPDDPDLGFRLSAQRDDTSFDEYAMEKIPGFGKHSARKPTRADERVREEAYQAIDSRSDIDAPDISLHVKDGVVTIEGEVADAMLRHRIEQCVDSVDGVKDINNRLHLASPHPRRPWSDE